MKKIFLFACIEKNFGDDLFIYNITNRYKNYRFITEYTAKYGDLKYIQNLSFSFILKLLRLFCKYNSFKTSLKRNLGLIIYKIIAPIIGHKNTIIYIVGNAFKNYNYIGKQQIQWLKNLIKLSSNFYLLSTNYGPCNDNRWISDCSEVFEKMTDVCFRDIESYNLFSSLRNVRYAPDAVLTLKTDISKVNANIKNIVISMINCRERYMDNVKEKADIYEIKLSELVNRFIDDGYNVTLMCSNTIQDLPAAERIKNNCMCQSDIVIFKYDGNLNDVFELYRKSKYVISTRLHSMILSWVFHTPVFPISYDIKVTNVIKSYNFNNDYCELSDIENLTFDRIMKAFSNYDSTFLTNLQLEAEKQFEKLDKVLGYKNYVDIENGY